MKIEGLDHESAFFTLWHRLSGAEQEGSLEWKAYWFGSFLALIEIGGVREWAQFGSAGIREVREILSQAGMSELISALDGWIGSIPGGLERIDDRESHREVIDLPQVDRADSTLYYLVMRNGNRYAAEYLQWYHSQSSMR